MKRQHRNKKELTEVQKLKQSNRKLREENGSLKRRIRQLEKTEHLLEQTYYEDPEDIDDIPRPEKCPSCFKGDIEHISVVGRHWIECSLCDYRTKTIKEDNDKKD